LGPWYIANIEVATRHRWLNIISYLLSHIPYIGASEQDLTLPKWKRLTHLGLRDMGVLAER
jgi:hypothetical protein